jgi:hypothetical protein
VTFATKNLIHASATRPLRRRRLRRDGLRESTLDEILRSAQNDGWVPSSPRKRFALDQSVLPQQPQKPRQSRRTPKWLERGSSEELSTIRPRPGHARFAPNFRRTETFTPF